jgi:hypothetical protein
LQPPGCLSSILFPSCAMYTFVGARKLSTNMSGGHPHSPSVSLSHTVSTCLRLQAAATSLPLAAPQHRCSTRTAPPTVPSPARVASDEVNFTGRCGQGVVGGSRGEVSPLTSGGRWIQRGEWAPLGSVGAPDLEGNYTYTVLIDSRHRPSSPCSRTSSTHRVCRMRYLELVFLHCSARACFSWDLLRYGSQHHRCCCNCPSSELQAACVEATKVHCQFCKLGVVLGSGGRPQSCKGWAVVRGVFSGEPA